MHFKIQVVIEEESGQSTLEDIVELNKGLDHKNTVGLSLLESKQLLQSLQRTIVLHQAASYSKAHQDCRVARRNAESKGHHTIQFRSLFGIVAIPGLRLYHCSCANSSTKSFSPLNEWLPEHTSPELMYIQTKWASLMSYGSTADLLHDVLPVNQSLTQPRCETICITSPNARRPNLKANQIIYRVAREIGGNYRSPANRWSSVSMEDTFVIGSRRIPTLKSLQGNRFKNPAV